jgi:hypothetical protein
LKKKTLPEIFRIAMQAGNADPINNLQPTQVVGTAIVGSKATPQTIQATGNVVPLAVKPNPTVAAGAVNVLEIYDNVPSTSMFVRGDGIAYFKNKAGFGTTSPTESIEVAGGNLKVSGSAFLSTVSGNVGIGTVSPTAKLDVQGTLKTTALTAGTVSVTTMTAQYITPALWHNVGAVGEPAFVGGAWGSYGGGWTAVSFQKDAAGWVRLRGMAKALIPFFYGTPSGELFILPPGFRPSGGSRFCVTTNDSVNGAYVQFLDIDPAGLVKVVTGTKLLASGLVGTAMSLDGVAFEASN